MSGRSRDCLPGHSSPESRLGLTISHANSVPSNPGLTTWVLLEVYPGSGTVAVLQDVYGISSGTNCGAPHWRLRDAIRCDTKATGIAVGPRPAYCWTVRLWNMEVYCGNTVSR